MKARSIALQNKVGLHSHTVGFLLLVRPAGDAGRLAMFVEVETCLIVGAAFVVGCEGQCLFLPLDRVVEFAALGAGGSERVEKARFAPFGEFARPGGAFACPLAVADVRVGAGGPNPRELVEGAGAAGRASAIPCGRESPACTSSASNESRHGSCKASPLRARV